MKIFDSNTKYFKKYGFLKLNNFYKNKEISSFKKEVNVLKKSKSKKIAKYYQLNLSGDKNDLYRIEYFYSYSKVLKNLIDSKKVSKLLFGLTKKKYILFKEKINIKPANSREDRLHQDVQGDWLKYSKNFITLLISLVKTNNKNGNLIIDVSGHNKDQIRGKMFEVLKSKQLKKPKFKNQPTNPGDILLFNGFTPHKSTKNLTNKSRDQIYITYCETKNKNTRQKYFKEKFSNCPPNIKNNNKKFAFKN